MLDFFRENSVRVELKKWRSHNTLAIVNGHNKNSEWNGAQVGPLSRGQKR